MFIDSLLYFNSDVFNYSKGKVIPLPAWTGCEGYRILRLPDFKIMGT